jgi:hypothetical protein
VPQNLNLKLLFHLIILSLLGVKLSYAQYPTVRERIQHLQDFDEKFLHYGYFFGFNEFGYKIEYVRDYSGSTILKGRGLPDINIVKNFGFNVGLIGDMRINKFLNLRFEPGLYYSQRDFIYPKATPDLVTDQDYLREIKSTYIHLPFLVKFSSERINNFRPFLVGGISTSFNLSSNDKNKDDNSNNVFIKPTTMKLDLELTFIYRTSNFRHPLEEFFLLIMKSFKTTIQQALGPLTLINYSHRD